MRYLPRDAGWPRSGALLLTHRPLPFSLRDEAPHPQKEAAQYRSLLSTYGPDPPFRYPLRDRSHLSQCPLRPFPPGSHHQDHPEAWNHPQALRHRLPAQHRYCCALSNYKFRPSAPVRDYLRQKSR